MERVTASSSSSSTHLIHNILRHPKPPSSVCLFLRPFCFSASISQSNHHSKPRLQSFSSKPLPSHSIANSFSSIDEPDLEDEESEDEYFSAEEYEYEEGEEEEGEMESGVVSVRGIEDSEASEEISEMGLGDKEDKTEKTKKKSRGSALKLSIKEKKELASYAHSLGDKLKCQLVGKSGVTDSVVFSFLETLEKNELLKVGEAQADHDCWERPEDMDTPRTAFALDAPHPAYDLAGEIAAALAAASIAFKQSNPKYSRILLYKAVQTFQYADSQRGSYIDNPEVNRAVCPFYCSVNGYKDELLWGAAWLRRATGKDYYLTYLVSNRQAFGANFFNYLEFGWDNKVGGVNVLIAKEVFEKNVTALAAYKDTAEKMMCAFLPETSGPHMTYTPGGLLYKHGGSQLQNTAALSFLLLTYADYLTKSSQQLNCGNIKFQPDSLRRIVKRQVDYVLGDNPMKLSYMIGYGEQYPRLIHHRGSSIPSVSVHPNAFGCSAGWNIFASPNPNPNILIGAVIGGPTVDDKFIGGRNNATETEPTTYINAPFVGLFAYFKSNPNFS